MPARPERRLTYANVMSTVAVFFALSGTAVAGTLITSGDVKNNSLKSVDLKDNKAVASVDVVDGSLTGADVDETSLAKVPAAGTADSATSAGTATNATNATNATHAESADSAIVAEFATNAVTADNADTADHAPVSGYHRVYSGDKTLAANASTTFDADCVGGTVAISGGFWTSAGDVEAVWGYVVDDNTYRVAFWNTNGSTARTVGVHVVCVFAVP